MFAVIGEMGSGLGPSVAQTTGKVSAEVRKNNSKFALFGLPDMLKRYVLHDFSLGASWHHALSFIVFFVRASAMNYLAGYTSQNPRITSRVTS